MFGYERFQDGESPKFVRTNPKVRCYDLDDPQTAHEALQLAIDGLIAWSAWYKRDVFKDARFRPYRNCEDTLWGLCSFFRARTLAYVDARPYGYRNRTGSASNLWGFRRLVDTTRAMSHVVSAATGSRHAGWYFRRTFKYALGMVYRTAFPKRRSAP